MRGKLRPAPATNAGLAGDPRHAARRPRRGRPPRRASAPARPARHTDETLAARRSIAEHADYLVATRGERPIGFACSWVGPQRLGIVEDVFVHPDLRRQGIASALVATAVSTARRRGASAVSIAADPHDTPKAPLPAPRGSARSPSPAP